MKYGATTSYGNVSSINSSLTTTHSVTLNSLSPATLYHFEAMSKDAAANLATSADFTFTTLPVTGDQPPTVAIPANANPSPVAAKTTALSVLGADDGGEPKLTYSWSQIGTPPASVSFSVNGTNAAKNSVATFTQAGDYSLLVVIMDQSNQTISSKVIVTVTQTPTTISVSPISANVSQNTAKQFSATVMDQFGEMFVSAPSFIWTVSGGGSIDNTGLFAAGSDTGGPFTVTASVSGKSGTAQLTVIDATPPTISNVDSSNITANGATIVWNTDEPADSQVEYGVTSSYGNTSPMDLTLALAHSVSLTGLTSGTLIHYRVKSNDNAGNAAVSGDQVFTTLAVSAPAPISNLNPSSARDIQIIAGKSSSPLPRGPISVYSLQNGPCRFFGGEAHTGP